MFSRRQFLPALPALLTGAAACSRPAPARRPNILLVLADDQSFPHAGAYGARGLNTPAFDRVAREGALFSHAYSAAPSCTPSRSVLLTGRYPWQTGEAGLLYGTLPKDLPLFTHRLEDAGYRVGHTGKGWLPGDWKAGGLTRHPLGKEYNQRRHQPAPRPGLDPRDYAANFADFLADRPKSPADPAPFFFWLGATEPHRVYAKGAGLALGHQLDEVDVPDYWPDTPEVRSDILDYYAEIEWLDAQLAKVLAHLEASGELENTLIVVTSDNGMPFPRAKVNLYDRGVHMPLAIRWGARLKPGRTIDDFVSHIDLAPTFLAAAGLEAPAGAAGRSLLGLLESSGSGQIDPARDAAFSGLERHVMARPDGAGYPMRAIHTAEYAYIRNYAPERWPTGGEFISSNRTTHGDVDAAPIKDFLIAQRDRYPEAYALNFGRRPAEELYRLSDDPHQVRNLAADPALASVRDQLRARLDARLKETGDPRQAGQDPWRSYPYRQTTGYGASFNSTLTEEQRRQARNAPPPKPE